MDKAKLFIRRPSLVRLTPCVAETTEEKGITTAMKENNKNNIPEGLTILK